MEWIHIDEMELHYKNQIPEVVNRIVEGMQPSKSEVEQSYCVIATAYLAYWAIFQQISSVDELKKWVEEHFSESRKHFLNRAIGNNWDNIIALSRDGYTVKALISVVLWYPIGFERYNRIETVDSIARLAAQILGSVEGNYIDLCCGTGSVLVEMAKYNKEAEFTGIELNPEYSELAAIRLECVSDKGIVSQTSVFDFDQEEPYIGKKYDRIFCDYPWGMGAIGQRVVMANREFYEQFIPSNRLERFPCHDWFFIINAVRLLKEDGKAVVLTNNGITWNGGINSCIRARFIEMGLIEAVITLPGNLIPGTNVAMTLLVLSNGNKEVRMIDASNMYERGRRQNYISEADINEILYLLHNDGENSTVADAKSIEDNDYVITPSRYLSKVIEPENGVALEDVLLNVTRGAQIKADELDDLISKEPTGVQYLMLADVQDGLISKELPYLKNLDRRLEKYCLHDKNIIISKNGAPFKKAVARVRDNQRILANGNLYVLEVDETKINPYFLMAYLESEQGSEALNAIAVGTALINIPVEGLRKLRIPLPSLAIQNEIAQEYEEKLKLVKKLKLKLEMELKELRGVYDRGPMAEL